MILWPGVSVRLRERSIGDRRFWPMNRQDLPPSSLARKAMIAMVPVTLRFPKRCFRVFRHLRIRMPHPFQTMMTVLSNFLEVRRRVGPRPVEETPSSRLNHPNISTTPIILGQRWVIQALYRLTSKVVPALHTFRTSPRLPSTRCLETTAILQQPYKVRAA